jgi:predicted nucleic acid-binding protein
VTRTGLARAERVLLDSVILIDHLNGIATASSYLAEVKESASISVITRVEVLTGGSEDDLPVVTRLLDRFPLIGIDRQAADLAARLRRRHRWSVTDALQAALAQLQGLKLATRNTRDFPPRKHRFVTVPYSI